MTLFQNIIREAIASDLENKINAALNNHSVVRINYESQTKEDTESGERTIYPTAYGISTANNPVIRAYQEKAERGDTASITPAWKLFRLDGIKNWTTTEEKFTTRDVPGVKFQPDLQMSIEFNSAFGGEKVDKTIDDTPITKDEISVSDKLGKTSNYTPSQKATVKSPENIDNFVQNTDTPSGINPQTPIAPKNEPITKDQFISTPTSEPEIETPNTEALPAEPIMHNNTPEADMERELDQMTDEKAEETDEELRDELNEVYNLMNRMNKLYRRR